MGIETDQTNPQIFTQLSYAEAFQTISAHLNLRLGLVSTAMRQIKDRLVPAVSRDFENYTFDLEISKEDSRLLLMFDEKVFEFDISPCKTLTNRKGLLENSYVLKLIEPKDAFDELGSDDQVVPDIDWDLYAQPEDLAKKNPRYRSGAGSFRDRVFGVIEDDE